MARGWVEAIIPCPLWDVRPVLSLCFLVFFSHLLCKTRRKHYPWIPYGNTPKPGGDRWTTVSQAISYALFGCVTKATDVGGNDQQPMVEDDVIRSA